MYRYMYFRYSADLLSGAQNIYTHTHTHMLPNNNYCHKLQQFVMIKRQFGCENMYEARTYLGSCI